MKVGDLVVNIDEPEHGIGVVIQMDVEMWGQVHEPPGIKVLWRSPIWHCPVDGSSIMYQDEVEIISEAG